MLILLGFHQFLGEGGHKKNNIYGELPKKGLGQFLEGLAKNKEEGVFEGGKVTMTWLWYMPELKIGFADVSALNSDQYFLQFNAKKKINVNKSSQFEFKC